MKNRPLRRSLAASALAVTLWCASPADLRSQVCPDAGIVPQQATVQEAIRQLGLNVTNLCSAATGVATVDALAGVGSLRTLGTGSRQASAGNHTHLWADIGSKPTTFPPSGHGSSHQNGGSDEVSTATPGANLIPKAGSNGKLAPGWTAYDRVVIVDSAGKGDFTTLSAAITFINTQIPSILSPWTVTVMPGLANPGLGNYAETTLTVPAFVTVQGYSTGDGVTPTSINTAPIVKLTCTSGTCLTLQGGATLANLLILWQGTPTAAVKVVECTTAGQGVGFYNVAINITSGSNAFPVDAFTNTSGSAYFVESGITMSGNASGRMIVQADTNSGRGVTVYSARIRGSSGCATLVENVNTGGGINLFSGTRLDAGCAVDLRQTAGTITVYPGVSYGPVSGTITNATLYSPYGATNPATCSPGQDFLNTTTPARCSCVATNTWKCMTLI